MSLGMEWLNRANSGEVEDKQGDEIYKSFCARLALRASSSICSLVCQILAVSLGSCRGVRIFFVTAYRGDTLLREQAFARGG